LKNLNLKNVINFAILLLLQNLLLQLLKFLMKNVMYRMEQVLLFYHLITLFEIQKIHVNYANVNLVNYIVQQLVRKMNTHVRINNEKIQIIVIHGYHLIQDNVVVHVRRHQSKVNVVLKSYMMNIFVPVIVYH